MYMENTRDRVSSKLQRINGGRNEVKRIERTIRAQSKKLEENVSASVDISGGAWSCSVHIRCISVFSNHEDCPYSTGKPGEL